MQKSKIALNVISFFVLILGFVYIILSEYYMGFDRDLVYREYILEKDYLVYINFLFLSAFWGSLFFVVCRDLIYRYDLYKVFNAFIFLFLCFITLLYQYDIFIRTMLFAVFNLFGFFRVALYLLNRGH